MMTGNGELNEWASAYAITESRYLGYIADGNGNRIYIPEGVSGKVCELLNELIETLGDIADRFDTYKSDDAKSLCVFAYEELYKMGHIIPNEQWKEK